MSVTKSFTINNPVDSVHYAVNVMDAWHSECHQGHVYGYHYDNLSLASNSSVYLHIKSGVKDVHLDAVFAVLGGHLQVQWYGSPLLGTAGTVLACINRNRYYKDVPALTAMYIGSTVSTVGTVLFGARTLLGAAAVQSKVGSNIVDGAERILLPNTDYLVKFTAVGVIAFTIDGLFYEETH
jgi:hypothetical protein